MTTYTELFNHIENSNKILTEPQTLPLLTLPQICELERISRILNSRILSIQTIKRGLTLPQPTHEPTFPSTY